MRPQSVQNSFLHIRAFAVVAIASAILASLGQSQAKGKPAGTTPPYQFTDLRGFTDGAFVQSEAFAISDSDGNGISAIAGSSYIFPTRDFHPVLWEATNTGTALSLQDLGTLPGITDAIAVDVNDGRVAVGVDDAFVGLGFVSIPGVGLRPLPSLGGSATWPTAVNNWGDIVGEAEVDGGADQGAMHGALWHVDEQGTVSGPMDLGDFHPQDINDTGLMAGWNGSTGTPAVAYFDESGLDITDLPLGNGMANAINIHGDVVGTCRVGSIFRSFVREMGAAPILLPDLGGPQNSALDINDNGQIVGRADKRTNKGKTAPTYIPVAVLWENGVFWDLNGLAGMPSSSILLGAEGINNRGQIVGEVRINSSGSTEQHGFLLTKKP